MANEILKKIKSSMGNNPSQQSIRWPSKIETTYESNDGTVRCLFKLSSQTVISNMQSNESAFEGWATVVKAWIDTDKNLSIELAWEAPDEKVLDDDQISYGHYQRFLYRAIRFSNKVDWFKVAKSSKKHLDKSDVLYPDGSPKDGPFLINQMSKRDSLEFSEVPTPAKLKDLSESAVEKLFISHPDKLLETVFGPGKGKIDRQFPVGIFKGKVTGKKGNDSGHQIFSGKKSAIDLWAVSDSTISLFELKKPTGNKSVGSLSELIFYANIVGDCANGTFQSDYIFFNASEIKRIKAFLLLGQNNIHPLLANPKIYDDLNFHFKERNIEFGVIEYDGQMSCEVKY